MMKTMKYLLMAVLTAGFSTAAMAQDGSKADVDAVKKIISSKPADLEKQIKPYYKANKKNAENLVAFGRAFYEAKDTANARVYANYALTVTKYKCAPAFILLGDIEALTDDTNAGGVAAQYYDQAITADPKNPDGYYKYALVYRKINPKMAAQRLDELKVQRPDVEVDAIKGHIYAISKNKDKEAFEAYSKVPLEKLDRGYLSEFASACFFTGKHADGLRVVEFATSKYPRYATFNRLGMMFGVELKEYEKALSFADRFFNASDSAQAHNQEYFYQGLAYNGLKNYDKAIELFQKALTVKSEGNLVGEESIMKSISGAYQAKGDYDNAAAQYKTMLSNKKDAKYDDFEALAKIYLDQASDSTTAPAAKTKALQEADAVYADLVTRYENNKRYTVYRRASIGNMMDPDLSKGAAKPHYEELVAMLEPKADKDAGDKQILGIAYHYLMAYSFQQANDIPKAKEFAAKLLEINPDHAGAQAVMGLKAK